MSENKEKKPTDASAEISFDPSRSVAFMVLHPPKDGGKDISVETVNLEIKKSGVVYGIMEDRIEFAVKTRRYNESIGIARWKAPVNGENGRVEYFYERDKVAAPAEDENGVVDYKDLGIITNIYAGTRIARIFPPTEGEEGIDVLGNPVPQKRGLEAKVVIGKGTQLMDGGREIVASVDGDLRFKGGGFLVEEELVIKEDVDAGTGNIDFIGNITVKGNVLEGYRVTSKKNITIYGAATEAELDANGDITVRMGCVNSHISCRGSAKFGFCEKSTVKCGGNVESGSFIGCKVYAGGGIIATGKGIIAGGKYTAIEKMEASVIGAESYTKTYITLGNNAVLSEERERHIERISDYEFKTEQIEKLLNTLNELQKKQKLPPEREKMRLEAVKVKFQMRREIQGLMKRIEQIDEELKLRQQLSVYCKKQFYPGTTIRINDLVLEVNDVYNHSRAYIEGDEIVIFPY